MIYSAVNYLLSFTFLCWFIIHPNDVPRKLISGNIFNVVLSLIFFNVSQSLEQLPQSLKKKWSKVKKSSNVEDDQKRETGLYNIFQYSKNLSRQATPVQNLFYEM